VGLLVLAFLTPCGIVLPRIFHADGAWGEWGAERLGAILGYVPEGLKGSGHMWKAPVSDYTFPGGGDSLAFQMIAYAASGVLGLLLAVCLVFLLMKMIRRHER
jgi:hypothetical protein